MVAVERAREYVSTSPEDLADGKEKTSQHTADWPQSGAVEFKNVDLAYKDGHLALNGLNFSVKGGERIGVVGRTGAGKSSVFQALFRMVDVAAGHILIDGLDITNVSRMELRNKLAIIPQDPVLFAGSVRDNLDPFHEYDDAAVWSALDSCALKEAVVATGGLNSVVLERGKNFSLGQRQLMCLGRALLKRSKVICIDEATANVDHETDELIQRTLQTQFTECTVITVAHRLETILDSDRILVMSKGRSVDFDTPDVLRKRDGLFSDLLRAANLT